jgi:hypothetical protein
VAELDLGQGPGRGGVAGVPAGVPDPALRSVHVGGIEGQIPQFVERHEAGVGSGGAYSPASDHPTADQIEAPGCR